MFRKYSIFSRLIILAGVMIIALFINSMIGWIGFRSVSNSLDEVYYGSVDEIAYLMNIKSLFEVNIIDTVHKVRDETLDWNEGEENIRLALNDLDSNLKNFLSKYHTDYEGRSSQLKEVEILKKQMAAIQPRLEKLLDIFKRKNQENIYTFAVHDLYPLIDPVMSTLNQIIDGLIVLTRKDYQEGKSFISFYQILIFITFFLALLISLIIAYLITKSINQPLTKAINALNKVSLGELPNENYLDQYSEGEMGQLFAALNKMINSDRKIADALLKFAVGEVNLEVEPRSEKDVLSKSLNDMIHSSKKICHVLTELALGNLNISVQPRSEKDSLGLALAKMTKKLSQIIGSIQTEIISLNNSSQEIVSSVSQVAAGSSETATAVTETTTTVEELKQTAHVSAEKAKEVLAKAEDTLKVVKESEKSLQTTISDMNQINDKMRSISEGIIKLSEFSQSIGEIIDTVNDIAEQSNLLAVNAAIEAAKAGDQGKGFGIVAQEIRTLAEQSKAATVQVRAILNDIQNATSSAVLSTEQGSRAVEKGVNQSTQTNESMRVLLSSIGYVTQAANQIAISSQQQLVGVDQVNMAMNSINEATRQHIGNMQTIENSIKAFNSIGQTLKEITHQYRLTSASKNDLIEQNESNFS